MSITSIIDDPEDQCITKPVCNIRGWCSSGEAGEVKNLHIRIGELPVPYSTQSRPDVAAAFPGKPSVGFLIRLDLSYYLTVVRNNELVLCLVVPGADPVSYRFRIAPGVVASCLRVACCV